MPTRKRKNDNSSEINELKRKLKKLEHNSRERSRRRIRVLSSSSSECTPPASRRASPPPESPRPRHLASPARSRDKSSHRNGSRHRSPSSTSRRSSPIQDARSLPMHDSSSRAASSSGPRVLVVEAQMHAAPASVRASPVPTACTEPRVAPSMQPAINEVHEDNAIEILPDAEAGMESELSSDILEILGEDPSLSKTFGKDIQKDLAIRFNYLATNGLTKESRKELREKYPVPANCTLIDAPQMNPEVKAAVSETVLKRLGGMEQKQKQLASAIACLGEAVTLLLSQKNADPQFLKLLMDAGRIMCDTQYNDSLTRRFFILASLKKEMKDQLLLTKIDSFLFGKELAETLKSAKAITKSGAELKQTYPSTKQCNWKANINKPAFKKNNNLNAKPAPSSHRSTGGSRPRLPAPRNQPVNSSRTSRPTSKRSHH